MAGQAAKRISQFSKPLLFGLLYFMALIGMSQGLVALNARVSPAVPWFPLPALGLVAALTWWVGRRRELRWSHPAGVRWGAAYAFACLATFAAVCISVLEGWLHDLDRPAPLWPDETVSTLFQVCFLLVIPFIAGACAEIGFRGIIQTQFEKLLPIWPMLFLIAVINGFMHFYDPEQGSQWLRFISLNLGFGYITWRTQSILPALCAHVLMNFFEPMTRYILEPVPYRDLSAPTLAFFGVAGSIALAAAITLNRRIGAPADSGSTTAGSRLEK